MHDNTSQGAKAANQRATPPGKAFFRQATPPDEAPFPGAPASGRRSYPQAPAPGKPFLRQEGLRRGLTKHHLDGPSYRKLFGSVRLSAHVEPNVLHRATAAVLVVPGSVVSHHTAASLWGGVVPDTPVTHVTVTRAKQRRGRPGLQCHVKAAPEVIRRQDLLVTTPAQTFVDLAHDLGLVDVVVLGDSLVHKGVVNLDQLRTAADSASGSGAARARAAARRLREGSESPMETRVRLMLHFAGLPEPTVQLEVAAGRYRLDLAWPVLRIAVEYDGRQHADDVQQWGRDLGRREWLDGEGWRLIVLRATDVYDDPWAAILRIAEAMSLRGYEKVLDGPPPEFAEYFPGRPWRNQRG